MNNEKTINQLPQGYLSNGYEDENGNMYLNYLTDTAMEIAGKLAPMKAEVFRQMYASLLEVEYESFKEQQKAVNKLVPVAARLVGKRNAPSILLDFCKANAEAVKSTEDFRYFVCHMEAVFCFMA